MTFMRPLAVAATVLVLSACASSGGSATTATPSSKTAAPRPVLDSTSTVQTAKVNLTAASGSLVSGTLQVVPIAGGVRITGEIGGLPRNGNHGFHIHEKGDCSAADASSAGGHFNPANAPHGRVRQGQHHGGDSDNLSADAKGVARVDRQFVGVVMGGGAANDIIGKAVVVHADPDDYTSQPSGNAGARIACGVIKAG